MTPDVLTATEAAIYRALEETAGVPLGPIAIARRIWEGETIGTNETKTIHQHVSHIRKKLGYDAIQCIPWVGYRLGRYSEVRIPAKRRAPVRVPTNGMIDALARAYAAMDRSRLAEAS